MLFNILRLLRRGQIHPSTVVVSVQGQCSFISGLLQIGFRVQSSEFSFWSHFPVLPICRNVHRELQQVHRQRAYVGGCLRPGAALVVVTSPPCRRASPIRTFLRYIWSLAPIFLFLQEQIKDCYIIIITPLRR